MNSSVSWLGRDTADKSNDVYAPFSIRDTESRVKHAANAKPMSWCVASPDPLPDSLRMFMDRWIYHDWLEGSR